MRLLKPVLMLAALSLSTCAFAQKSYHVPENVKLDSASDYMPYKQDVIDATAYLKSLPRGREAGNRKAVSAFLTRWTEGSPDVDIILTGSMLRPMKDDMDLMMLYIASWASYALETGDYSKYTCNAAAARAVVDYYKDPANNVPRNKRLELWVKKQEEGKLESYVTGLMTAEEHGRNAEE